MCGGSPSAPRAPAQAPEAPRLPETGGVSATASRNRRRAAGSRGGTILTSASGVQTPGAIATNTLLGQ